MRVRLIKQVSTWLNNSAASATQLGATGIFPSYLQFCGPKGTGLTRICVRIARIEPRVACTAQRQVGRQRGGQWPCARIYPRRARLCAAISSPHRQPNLSFSAGHSGVAQSLKGHRANPLVSFRPEHLGDT